MKHLLRRFYCWLRDHPVETTAVQVTGRIAYIDRCRCGRTASIRGRALQYPLRRIA